MSPERGRCPACHRSIVLRGTDGYLRVHFIHYPAAQARPPTKCKGSGQPPAKPVPAVVEHQHPRRTN